VSITVDGTATGAITESGILTTVGTETHNEVGTATTTVYGNGEIKTDGTDVGTFV
jgi:hypothetical protein